RGGDLFVPPDSTRVPGRRANWLAVPAAVVLVSLLLQTNVIPTSLGKVSWSAFDAKLWPETLVPQLQAQGRARIFNELNLGGFVIFHAPQLAVFIDDRCE